MLDEDDDDDLEDEEDDWVEDGLENVDGVFSLPSFNSAGVGYMSL
jgi:hypothetical protein